MKKKVFSVVLVIMMVFALAGVMTGCGNGDPVEAFDKAATNLSKADDVAYDGTFKMSMEAEGQSMNIAGDLNMVMADFAEGEVDDIKMAMDLNMDLMGQKTHMKVYMKDGFMYADDGAGNKTKGKAEKDTIESLTSVFASDQKIDDYVKESKWDGDDAVLTVDSKKYLADFMGKVDSLGNESGSVTDVKQIKAMMDQLDIGEMTITATIKDENYTAMKVDIPIEIDLSQFAAMLGGSSANANKEAQKFKMNVNCDLNSIKVNSGDEIEFPDFSEFK